MSSIDTEYKGYLFRSRLEAKWAIFLDMLGEDWEHEAESFNVGGGFQYLPDFRVRNLWLEVKPKEPLSEREYQKIIRFTESRPEYETLIICDGTPEERAYTDVRLFLSSDEDHSLEGLNKHISRNRKDDEGWGYCFFNDHEREEWVECCLENAFYLKDEDNRHFKFYRQAVNAAKQARFEFGEVPRVDVRRRQALRKQLKN